MKKAIIIILLFLAFTKVDGQVSLVPNGDFELYSKLPDSAGQSYLAIGWNNVNGIYLMYPYASPDYFNMLSFSEIGSIIPYSGNSQMGFLVHYENILFREYISTQLSTSMIPGHQYLVSFYLTNGNDTLYTKVTNNIGIIFSNNPLFQATHEPILEKPQLEIDTIVNAFNTWRNFSFVYTANDIYKYMTIGNFRDDNHTMISSYGSRGAYYFIDKIEIYDTGKITYLDIYIPNAFTPNGDGINDIFKIETLKVFSEFHLYIYNRWGEKLFESNNKDLGWDGTFKDKLVPFGIYTYLITGVINGTNEQIKRTGSITVLR